MGYCALLIPKTERKEVKSEDLGFFESLKGKLMSGLNEGGFSFENATTVLKNTASLISSGTDTIGNKFSGIALTQLLVEGKITNETAFGYLTQGFPKALGFTSVSMGFQSLEQLKTALKDGINVQQFTTAFQGFGSSILEFTGADNKRKNVEGYDIIEVDAVISDTRNYQSETPDRRVESGQTYQEFIHNMPDILSLECVLQDGRRYTSDEFEDILLNLRDRKIAINIILGEDTKESFVLTNFTPVRQSTAGYNYTLEFKRIQVGEVNLVSLNMSSFLKSSIVENKLNNDTKTNSETSKGFFEKNVEMAKDLAEEWAEGIGI